MFLTILFYLIITLLFYKIVIHPSILSLYYKNQKLPTKFLPLLGTNFIQFKDALIKKDFYQAWKQMSTKIPKPKAFNTNITTNTKLVVFEPELIKEIYMNQKYYRKPKEITAIFQTLMPHGMPILEGEEWKKERKLMMMAFHFDYLKELIPEIAVISEEMLEKIRKNKVEIVNIKNEFSKISAEILGRIFFGDLFKHNNQFQGVHIGEFFDSLLDRMALVSFSPFYQIFGVGFVKLGLMKNHRELIKDIRHFRESTRNLIMMRIEKLKEERETIMPRKRKDLVEILHEQSRYTNNQEKMNVDEILDQFLGFMVEGVSTISILLTMGTYFILENPEVKDELYKEIKNEFRDILSLSLDKLNKMDYLSAVIKETLRMVNPVPLMMEREAIANHSLGDLKIKRGTILVPGLIANNFDESYHHLPKKFMPERWISASKSQENIRENPIVYTPFGVGQRNCLGQHLAQVETKIILGSFLNKFDFQMVDKEYNLKMTQKICL